MTLFRFNWLRRLVRRHTNPIPVDRAAVWKSRLSVVYMVLTWNAFGFVCYMIYIGKGDWAKYYGIKSEEEENLSAGQRWAKTLGTKEAAVYRVSGFKVTRYEDHNKDTEDDEKQTDNIIHKKIS